MFLTCARNTLPAEIFLQNVSVGLFALNVVCRKHAFYKSGKNFLQIVFLVSIYCEPACVGKICTHNYMQVPINLAWCLIVMSAYIRITCCMVLNSNVCWPNQSCMVLNSNVCCLVFVWVTCIHFYTLSMKRWFALFHRIHLSLEQQMMKLFVYVTQQ